MKKQLKEYFFKLKTKLYEYQNFRDDCFSFTHEENQEYAAAIYENELVDIYCEFLDVYSYFCDMVIEDSKDEQLISQCMLFYYMMNKEYFASQSEEEDIKNIEHIVDQLSPHKDILNYEFFYETGDSKVCCDLCNNEGDIPDCILCGRPADIKDDKDKKRVKYKYNFDFKGPFCEDVDLKENKEIFCDKCKKYIKNDNFKKHCMDEHEGFLMVNTEENKKINNKREFIRKCERLDLDEEEINYILNKYENNGNKDISISNILKLISKFRKNNKNKM